MEPQRMATTQFTDTGVYASAHSPQSVIRDDFINALKEMNTYIDITVEDLMALNQKAMNYAAKRAKESIFIEGLMTTDVITVTPELPLADAAHLLVEHKISGLPVLNNAQQLAGIITEADLLLSIGLPSHHPSTTLWQTLESMFSHHHHELVVPTGIVGDLMIKNVIAVEATATLQEVIAIMKKHSIKRVVVCDRSKYVKGIVTRSNLVRVFFDKRRS
jgi:CBS domain-containing membrane protein